MDEGGKTDSKLSHSDSFTFIRLLYCSVKVHFHRSCCRRRHRLTPKSITGNILIDMNQKARTFSRLQRFSLNTNEAAGLYCPLLSALSLNMFPNYSINTRAFRTT